MNPIYSHTSQVYLRRRKINRQRIEELLSDGQKRRVKDVAKALELPINSVKEILTDLHELGKVSRTEAADDRETNRVLVTWFYREEI